MELRHEILQENSHPWKKQIFFWRRQYSESTCRSRRCLLHTEETEPNSIILEIFSIDKNPPPFEPSVQQKGFQRCICNRQLPNFSILVISKIIISSLWKCHSDMPSTHGLCSTFIQGVSFEPLLNGGSSIQIENWMIRRNYTIWMNVFWLFSFIPPRYELQNRKKISFSGQQ